MLRQYPDYQNLNYSLQVIPLLRTDEKPFTDVCAEDIYNFALNVPVSEIEFMLNAARLNGALSEEGLQNTYGLAIGRTFAPIEAVVAAQRAESGGK